MHIVYVISPFGGPEAYVQMLLPYLEKGNHKVSIIYSGTSTTSRSIFNDRVPVYHATTGSNHYYLGRLLGAYRAWAKRLRMWELSRSVYQVLQQIDRSNPIDVVEVTEGISTRLIARRWPVVLRAHGNDWTFRHFCQDKSQKYDYLLRQDARNHLVHANQVSAISNHLADYLSQACHFPRQLIEFTPYPINLSQFSPSGHQIMTNGKHMLLCIGRLEHRKGTDVLVQALPVIWEKYPDLEVYFLGKESQFTHEDLRKMVPEPYRKQLVFPGFVLHTQVPMYYRAATIYVAPTQYETFGYTILEAMACGKPVVSCSVGAIPELIKDGENGCLVPFGDYKLLASAISDLLDNPERRLFMGQQGKAFAEKYEVSLIGKQLELLYQEVQQKSVL